MAPRPNTAIAAVHCIAVRSFIAVPLCGPTIGRVPGKADNFNFRSQKAIEGIGAKKDGVIRHHAPRRDGTVRDTVIFSILAAEWRDVKRHLELRLARHAEKARAPAAR